MCKGKLGVLLTAGLLVCSLVAVSFPAIAGTTIRVIAMEYPNSRSEVEIKHEFEEMTGIKVKYTFYPWEGATDKLKVEIATKSSTYDIYYVDALMRAVFNPLDGFEPLNKYIDDPNLPDLNIKTIVPGLIELYETHKGQIVGIPCYACNRVYAYRKDLFSDPQEKTSFKEKYGYELRPPDTWDQYRDICEFFTRDTNGDGKIDFWGTSKGYAGEGPAWDELADVYESFYPIKDGRYWIDNEYKPIFNNPKAYQALQFMVDLVQSGFVSPGHMKKSWGDAPEDFSAGKTAMTNMFYDVYPDVEKSPIVGGKVGYFPVPKFEIHHTRFSSMDYSINKYSKNKEDAYRYLCWVFSDEADVRKAVATKAHGLPMRTPSFYEPEVIAVMPYLLTAMRQWPDQIPWPRFAEFEEMYRIVSMAVQNALMRKQTPKEALDLAAQELYEVMERAGYYR